MNALKEPGNVGIVGHGVRSILKNGVYLMASGWLEYLLRAIYIFALARFLGPEQYGIWAYGIAAYGLAVGLVGFGFDTLLPMRLGAYKQNAAEYLGLAATLRFVLLAVAAGGFAVYTIVGEPEQTSRTILFLLIPALAGRGAATWARVCFLSFERLGTFVTFSAIMRIAELCLGLVLLFVGFDLFAVVILHSVSWVVEGVAGSVLTRNQLAKWRFRFDRHEAVMFLRQGTVLGLSTSLYIWLTAGPLIMIRHFGNSIDEVGQIAIPLNVAMIMVASTQAYLSAALPVLSRSAKRQDPRVATYGTITILISLIIAAVAGVIGYFFGVPVLTQVLGAEFTTSGTFLGPCLVIGGIILAPTGYAHVLLLRGFRWHGAIANGCGGLVLTFGLPVAYGAWNLNGAVIVIGLAWLLRAVLLITWGLLRPIKFDAQGC